MVNTRLRVLAPGAGLPIQGRGMSRARGVVTEPQPQIPKIQAQGPVGEPT